MTSDREPWLFERAAHTPNADALIDSDGSAVSFARLAEAAGQRAAKLAVAPGERVVFACRSSRAAVETIHAIHASAAVLVPLSPRLTSREHRLLVDRVRPARVLDGNQSGGSASTSFSCRPMAPEAPHAIVFTSGTSGAAKGAMLSNAAQEASAHASAERLSLSAEDRWLCCLGFHHVGGLSILVRSAVSGFAVALQDGFDALAIDRALREQRISVVSLVPTMLSRLVETARGRRYPDTLRVVLTGGGPLDAALARRANDLGLPVVATYGLTEAASQVCTERRPGGDSCGPPLSGTTLRIDATDSEGVGEIVVCGPTMMSGYFEDPQASDEALRDGELRTGDLGRLDADGNLHVVCRRSDLIVSGGENVYPAEVESVLEEHPEVAEAGVYGRADPEWGQRVCAAIVLREGDGAGSEELQKFCRERLAGFKVPRVFEFRGALPKTDSGKLARARLVGD